MYLLAHILTCRICRLKANQPSNDSALEARNDSESRQMLEHAIETGRGGVYVRLTPDQYAGLR
jgi:hypothetical protein